MWSTQRRGGGAVVRLAGMTTSDDARAIILDCDPGLDDAVAMFLAQGDPRVELVAVTTVGGNAPLDAVTRNALSLATAAGVTAPVAAGAGRPLVAVPENASHIHGDDGLGGVTLPEPTTTLDPRHAVQVIIEEIMARPAGTVTLVPTGPLTNIALALRQEPRIVERVREVVFMGGGYNTGNATPVAEFNVYADPEAAAMVVGAGWPVTMVGLDLTHQAIATPDVVTEIAEVGTDTARLVADLLDVYGDAYRASGRGFEGAALHDPCAVALVIAPELFTCRPAPLDVELTGKLTRGMTVADLRSDAPEGCRTAVATHIDTTGFWALLREALIRLG